MFDGTLGVGESYYEVDYPHEDVDCSIPRSENTSSWEVT